MRVTNLREKLLGEVTIVYDAEHRFLEAQERMLERASEEELKGAIREHIEQARRQISNLEQVFRELGEEPRRRTCQAAKGLISDAESSARDAEAGPIRDAVLAAVQAEIENVQIASYLSMLREAELMNLGEAADLLRENLSEKERLSRRVERNTRPLLRRAARAS